MVTSDEIQRQLKAIKVEFRFWGRSEMHELEHIIVPHETIRYCLTGRYEGGFATLCVTDMRILLIDKKPFYLTLEDIRYDMISEIDFSKRLIDSTITICTVNKKLQFTSFKGILMRQVTNYVQGRIMEFRQQHMMQVDQTHAHLQEQSPVNQYIQAEQKQEAKVNTIQHRITNPYTKVPLVMRRKVSRFYSS